MRLSNLSLLIALLASCEAWTTSQVPSSRRSTALMASRRSVLQTVLSTSAASLLTATTSASVSVLPALAADSVTLPNGVSYLVKKSGNGPKPEIGELVAIRFAAYFGDVKIDDIFGTPEPYYTRIGSGGLLKGVEETLPLMQVGDRWVLTIPVSKQSVLERL